MSTRGNKLTFYVGEVEHTVNVDRVSPETTLNAYLREKMFLTGTKRMCLEGGCGVCVVAVESLHPKPGQKKVFAVNSCLVSLFSCQGWHIHTIEYIGNPLEGYNEVQKALSDNNGTQCGFCSPGMVMNMFALKKNGVTKAQVENSFGSNICRCTGYRPILDAFKQLASDNEEITDIEEIKPCNEASSCSDKCTSKCTKKVPIRFQLADSTKWEKVYNLKDLLGILQFVENDPYQLVAGNTARGVYRPQIKAKVFIDVTDVTELTNYKFNNDALAVGGNYTLTATMDLFRKLSKENAGFSYLAKLADHIDKVAHVPVRNIGTIAGNLMIKHQHKEFPSDIFLILETVKATLIIVDVDYNETRCSPREFLNLSMDKKVLREIVLTSYNENNYIYTSYKIMTRAQNTHALVNAGFLFNVNKGIVKKATICYGAINPKFVHATNTEKLLLNKNLFDNNVLQEAFKSLDEEIQPDYILPDPTPQFRKQLAIGLFYKCVLNIAPSDKISSRHKSGGSLLSRPISSGIQHYGTDKSKWPLSEPITKVEALAQTAGQAHYVADIPDLPYQLHAYFVTANATPGSIITNIDAKEALEVEGVVAFYGKDDIPGGNTFTPKNMDLPIQEELFCSGKVQHYFQPVGIVVATSQEVAISASELVKVTCTPPKSKPLINIKQVLKANAKDRLQHQTTFVRKRKGNNVKRVIKGRSSVMQQYHFHMEVQTCNVVPTEDGLDIYASTQWMDMTQCAASEALNIPSQKINVFVRRVGGAYGAKISRSSLVSTATALAAHKLRKPVKMWMSFEQNMNVIGKRLPFLIDYEVGVDDKGTIQYLDAELYSDYGVGGNEKITSFLVDLFENGYDTSTWQFDTWLVNTDTPANTWTRAPGSLEGLGAIECIMENIASELGIEDRFEVKMANVDKSKWSKLEKFIGDLKTSADVDNRMKQAKEFNNANRWKKKGMSLVPMVWTLEVVANYTIYVSIMHADGGVAISHGGIEIGQGINTKVVQVCAYKFDISIDKVQVKPSYNVIAPNSTTTGGSLTTEAVVYALLKACDILLDRMKPVREKMKNPKWEELIRQCFRANVQLSAAGFYSDSDQHPGLQEYQIFGVCSSEVEVDILTGEHQILRVDILEDVGNSMSPLIDVGQVEGAFVMGIGFYTTEELVFNEDGRLLTNRTWNYKPPGAKDIPVEFRITLPTNNPNPIGVLKSKAVAEPPICMSVSIPLAIRKALASARSEADKTKDTWYPMDGPSTVENTLLNTLNHYDQYVL